MRPCGKKIRNSLAAPAQSHGRRVEWRREVLRPDWKGFEAYSLCRLPDSKYHNGNGLLRQSPPPQEACSCNLTPPFGSPWSVPCWLPARFWGPQVSLRELTLNSSGCYPSWKTPKRFP